MFFILFVHQTDRVGEKQNSKVLDENNKKQEEWKVNLS